MPHLEGLKSTQRVKRDLLDEIAGIAKSARVGWQLAVRPSLEWWQTPAHERVDGSAVPALGLEDQLDRGFVRQRLMPLVLPFLSFVD